jgi:hypothetical protein
MDEQRRAQEGRREMEKGGKTSLKLGMMRLTEGKQRKRIGTRNWKQIYERVT